MSLAQTPDAETVDPLAVLEVIDRLEIGPVVVEPKRIVAPYRVVRGEETDTTELIYSYEEPVFTPGEPADHNLAALMAAQVALNYGLFCKEIVLRGSFDPADQRFLVDMAENTAREIYVNKFLEHNPFLQGAAAHLPVVKRSSYLRAVLRFPDEPGRPARHRWEESDRRRCVVLSSGGKDSLLSYGVLNEMGYEAHPVFANESGRHWFTALNAYRYFKDEVPHTARVWMNSDRLFAWMLRHLPFVRPDFASLRSDGYPIRLWTVAVFLFGVLPLARKRGAGRLLIGDEFDATHRISYQGIPYYGGLFDQSRFFDQALSRFYVRKGWRLSQFSILRPLSELLIEKILVARYPHLFEQQVSCHATHKDGERVRPCGKCEKCRRIVGMLTALGVDPTRCGYTEAQIRRCLGDLATTALHQESAAVEHLTWMLAERGHVAVPAGDKPRVRPRPEIMQLRFDPEHAPVEGLPVDLRASLFRLYLEHADGAVRRSGRTWVSFDPLQETFLNSPYAFEKGRASLHTPEAHEARPHTFLWGELTWPDARQRLREVDVALLPVGAIEQHGPHLPLDTDAFDADYLARAVAARCRDPKPLVMPLIPYGVSYHHDDFSGTLSVTNETLARMVYEIGMSAARSGITKLVIINGHGGNGPTLNFAAQMINRDAHIFVCVDSGETSDADIYKMIETPNDVHAGEFETSTSLAVRPHLVQMDKAEKLVPRFSSRHLDFTATEGVSWYAFTHKISPSGVMGDPTKATAEKGERMWQIMIDHLVAFVEDLKLMTLDEIYQKRY